MNIENLWHELKTEQWPIAIQDLPPETALVGGAVRDGLIRRLKENPDLDLVVPEKAITITNQLAIDLKGTCVILDSDRDIARLIVRGWTIDISSRSGESLEENLMQRDFSINAIAVTLNRSPKLIDPANGIDDLSQKRLVAIHEKNLIEDPLRLLRGIRLVAEMNLEISDQTKQLISKHKNLLTHSAPERIQSEINKLVRAPWADFAMLLELEYELLKPWENIQRKITIPPSLLKAKNLSTNELVHALPLARLTYLLSDLGLQKLCFSRKERQRCHLLRHWKNLNDGLAFSTLSETERMQLHVDLEKDLPALIIELNSTEQIKWLKRWRNCKDPLFHPCSPIDGNTLQRELGLSSGKIIGLLIKYLSIEQAFGRVTCTKEALNAASYWWDENKSLL